MLFVTLLLTACAQVSSSPEGTSTPSPEPSALSNQQQTERLRGTWSFFHLGAVPNVTLTLEGAVEENAHAPGEYVISGVTEGGDLVTAWYSAKYEYFTLTIAYATSSQLYTFDFDGANQITGDYAQLSSEIGAISRSAAFLGTRSADARAVSIQNRLFRNLEIYRSIRSK